MSEVSTTTILTDHAEENIALSQLQSPSTKHDSKEGNLHISRAYRDASDFFLTRRLSEAFSALEPVIRGGQAQGDEGSTRLAPIAKASRRTRVKVWSLYFTLLNSIIDLELEDGKSVFGKQEWRYLVAKTREGTIWEEVVQVGYGGVEASVDAEVVLSLATLLLSHSPSQALNQRRVESYLSAAGRPSLNILIDYDQSVFRNSEHQGLRSYNNGTDTPQELQSRIKILELYALHILPRNGEWHYAREFIGMSEALDEERRDAFLQALQDLKDQGNNGQDQEVQSSKEPDERQQLHRQEMEHKQEKESTSEVERVRVDQDQTRKKESESEKDYGIDEPAGEKLRKRLNGGIRPKATPQSKESTISKPSSASKKAATIGIYRKGVALFAALERLLLEIPKSISTNPLLLIRTIFLLITLMIAFSRREVRDRLSMITGGGWDKIKGTVGMGVKVSYI